MAEFNTPEAQQLNFVQRYLFPSDYPVIENEDGSISTHLMADAETDGRFVAYPTIVQEKKGKLRQLEDAAAFKHAMESGDFLEFPTQEEASAFAANGYKQAAGLGEKYRDAEDEQDAFDYRFLARKFGYNPDEW